MSRSRPTGPATPPARSRVELKRWLSILGQVSTLGHTAGGGTGGTNTGADIKISKDY